MAEMQRLDERYRDSQYQLHKRDGVWWVRTRVPVDEVGQQAGVSVQYDEIESGDPMALARKYGIGWQLIHLQVEVEAPERCGVCDDCCSIEPFWCDSWGPTPPEKVAEMARRASRREGARQRQEADPYESGAAEHNIRMRRASGQVDDPRPLVAFLYYLMRDHLPAGDIEGIVQELESGEPGGMFTNGWLAGYAQNLADRLKVPVGRGRVRFIKVSDLSPESEAAVDDLLLDSLLSLEADRLTSVIQAAKANEGTLYERISKAHDLLDDGDESG